MKRILTLSLCLSLLSGMTAQVKVYPYPSGKDSIEVMHDYRVSICAVTDTDEQWMSVTTLRCDVDMHRVQKASWAQWEMGEPVRVRVTNLRDDALADGAMPSPTERCKS